MRRKGCGNDDAEALGDTAARVHAIVVRVHSDNRNSTEAPAASCETTRRGLVQTRQRANANLAKANSFAPL